MRIVQPTTKQEYNNYYNNYLIIMIIVIGTLFCKVGIEEFQQDSK